MNFKAEPVGPLLTLMGLEVIYYPRWTDIAGYVIADNAGYQDALEPLGAEWGPPVIKGYFKVSPHVW